MREPPDPPAHTGPDAEADDAAVPEDAAGPVAEDAVGPVPEDAAEPASDEAAVHRCSFRVRWADLDANGHLKNTAYSEYATEARLRFLSENGFGPERFRTLGIGPVVFREEARYRREVLLGDSVTLDFRTLGLSEDGSHWRVAHRVSRSDGEEAAVLRLEGGWMELEGRTLVRPPPGLLEVLRRVPRAEEYEGLASLVRRRKPEPGKEGAGA